MASARLCLTAFEPEDAPEIFAAVTPTLTRFMGFEPSPSLDAFSEAWSGWIPAMASGRDAYCVIRSARTREFLGVAGLHGALDPEPEAGIWIKEAAHGMGYGREAVSTLLAWAARTLGVAGIVYPVVEQNRPSRRLAESLGGVIVGTRRLRKAGGLDYPVVVYRIAAPRVS